jgi:L-lactate dehydrogenase complex protein LldG
MNNAPREAILGSIRSHLAASLSHDGHEHPVNLENPAILSKAVVTASLTDSFKQALEAVDGHCIVAKDDAAIAQALTEIITKARAQRLAISDNPNVERLLQLTDLEIEELGVAPNASDIFRFDIGITSAQAAIADTGTLVLDSASERHRLASLVPPVHIAIIDASRIFASLGEVLSFLQKDKTISPAVTFVTGPSRTADIELTLAIGVHGPQELYVIVNEST